MAIFLLAVALVALVLAFYLANGFQGSQAVRNEATPAPAMATSPSALPVSPLSPVSPPSVPSGTASLDSFAVKHWPKMG